MNPLFAISLATTASARSAVGQSLVAEVGARLARHTRSLPLLVGGVLVASSALAWRYLRSERVRTLVDPMMVSSEGLVPGSPLLEGAKLPKCQVKLAIVREGVRYIVGAGIRLENCLVTAMHNGFQGTDLVAMGAIDYVVRSEAIILAPDLVAYELPEDVWARLGISQSRLAPLARSATVTVTSSCDMKYSVGELKPSRVLGRVDYFASTQPGFSGSPYMNGAVCMGIHIHGGAQAGGYEMLYVWARLKHHQQKKPEDSDTFFYDNYGGGETGFAVEELDEKSVILRDEYGHYHLTDADLISRLKRVKGSRAWDDQVTEEEIEEELARRGYAPESAAFKGEFLGLEARDVPQPTIPQPSPVVSLKLTDAQKPILTGREQLIKRLSVVSNDRLRRLLVETKNSRGPTKHTVSPKRTRSLNGDHSASSSTGRRN